MEARAKVSKKIPTSQVSSRDPTTRTASRDASNLRTVDVLARNEFSCACRYRRLGTCHQYVIIGSALLWIVILTEDTRLHNLRRWKLSKRNSCPKSHTFGEYLSQDLFKRIV